MKLPISRKAEKAFAAGYIPAALGVAGLNIYEGHERAEEVQFPALIIYAEGSSPHSDMPPETGVRVVRLRCKFQIDSMTTTRADVDAQKELLESAMCDIAAIQAALNAPLTGADNRLVRGIHFHHVEMSDDPSDVSETDWIEDLVFTVTCELLDT